MYGTYHCGHCAWNGIAIWEQAALVENLPLRQGMSQYEWRLWSKQRTIIYCCNRCGRAVQPGPHKRGEPKWWHW